jgi:uroporphyrinogen-III synthase
MLPRAMTVHVALRTVTLESRRSDELARLLMRHGLLPIEAPSLREVPLEDQREVFAFGEALLGGECDLLVLLTGVGARALVQSLGTRWSKEAIVNALGRIPLACRGPKPVAVLKELGLKPSITAPEPNTWQQLMAALAPVELGGARVWVQEYGQPNPALIAALQERGAKVQSAAVYAWQLPLDLAPLRRAVLALCDGQADAILVTSARQIDHLLEVAEQMGRRAALVRALQHSVLIGSIGPVTSEGLLEHGLRADFVPEHPKMGHLVKALAADGWRLLEAKRSAT